MAERRAIIESLFDQARDKDHLDNGNGEIFAQDAKILREAAMLLNMDADLRGQYEAAIQANSTLKKAQEPHVLTVKDFEQTDDYGYLPAVFEPQDMRDFDGAWSWELITQSALYRKDGRYWSGLASNEQMEATPWEG